MGEAAGGTARRSGPGAMWWYFGGLVVTYVVGLWALWPASGTPGDLLFLVIMMAPTVGALLARFVGGGRIRWGRPSWWILAGLAPAVVGLAAYLLAAAAGWVQLSAAVLGAALVASPVLIGSACLSAIGEEIGWRGFLWPTLREHRGFWVTSLIVMPIWWVYHVPLILLGWYGSLAGLPAFTVAIVGFTLFVGVITERSRGLWASTLAHGAWNGLVATSFATAGAGTRTPAFAGDPLLLGEFGWLAAVTTLILGVAVAVWHTRTTPVPMHITLTEVPR